VLPDDLTVATLRERITSLESALMETQSAVAASGARAALAEHKLAQCTKREVGLRS
jgi:hypothetical protein